MPTASVGMAPAPYNATNPLSLIPYLLSLISYLLSLISVSAVKMAAGRERRRDGYAVPLGQFLGQP